VYLTIELVAGWVPTNGWPALTGFHSISIWAQLQHAPFQFARICFGFPQTFSTDECVFISSALNSFGESSKMVHKTAAEHDIIGDQS